MSGKDALRVAKQHGNSISAMLRVGCGQSGSTSASHRGGEFAGVGADWDCTGGTETSTSLAKYLILNDRFSAPNYHPNAGTNRNFDLEGPSQL